MGQPYSYRRVLRDSAKYPAATRDGKFQAWWETYRAAEGFQAVYRPFADLYQLPAFGGRVLGILAMMVPHLSMEHVLAVDEGGIVDPADNAPDHIAIGEYVVNRLGDGFKFDEVFPAVQKGQSPQSR